MGRFMTDHHHHHHHHHRGGGYSDVASMGVGEDCIMIDIGSGVGGMGEKVRGGI